MVPPGEGLSLSAPGTFAPSSLVGYCIIPSQTSSNTGSEGLGPPPGVVTVHLDVPTCPNAGWLRGRCKEHGTERWVKMPCKRRGCEVCGKERKKRIAWRIAQGVESLGGDGPEGGAGWLVLTYDRDVTKQEAVEMEAQFIQWLKRFCKREFGFVPEWAKVWERTKNDRLHTNVICAPWHYIPQKVLAAKWNSLGGGRVMWIERVGAGIGVEAAKSREKIGNYVSKWDQMEVYGRGVSFSKGWPKLPKPASVPRRGEIAWQFVGGVSEEGKLHWYDSELGHWKEVTPGEWASADPEPCDCFGLKVTPLRIARGIMAAMRESIERERMGRFDTS